MSCTHKYGQWVHQDWGQLAGVYNIDGEPYTEDVYEETMTCVDLDTHRYQCTQCGKIMYYSERARKFYEEGKGELL